MTKYLMLTGALVTIFAAILLIKNINNKRIKYWILIVPFVLAGVLYIGIALMSKVMPPNVCDGAALIGIFVSFISLGMGIVFNIYPIMDQLYMEKVSLSKNLKYNQVNI